MGIDCKIMLPENVRVSDVAQVIGIAAGLKPQQHRMDGGGLSVRVPGAQAKPSNCLATCCDIVLHGELVDGSQDHYVLYHFEPGFDGRLLMPRATAFWIAVGRRLVDFFGGELDYNDCDDEGADYAVPRKSREENSPVDDQAWDDFQQRIFDVPPITKAELKEAGQLAAY